MWILTLPKVSFCKRKIGLLKKASELSVLCGIKITLVFTDLNSGVHTFTNNHDLRWKSSENMKHELGEDVTFVNYGVDDVSF